MVGNSPLGVQGPVDRIDDHPYLTVPVLDLSTLLGHGEEAVAGIVERLELRHDEALGLAIDHERPVASAASAAGLHRPLLGARRLGQHLFKTDDRPSAHIEPVCVQCGAS
jgi:hypothetical protein